MVFESNARTYPLRQPPQHNPPPRLHLVFPEAQKHVFTAYIGIQLHQKTTPNNALLQFSDARRLIQSFLTRSKPLSTEQFIVLNDTPNHTQKQAEYSVSNFTTNQKYTSLIWVCYWDSKEAYKQALTQLNLCSIYHSLPAPVRPATGLWVETFVSEIARLETVYSETDYMPGLARLPGTSTTKHVHTGYWGAARDRIPGSGEDLFTGKVSFTNDDNERSEDPEEEEEDNQDEVPKKPLSSLGFSMKGTNPSDMIHIRSGQFWTNCSKEESTAYIENIEPKLRNGLSYLWNNPQESGSFGVRYLRNTLLDLNSQHEHEETETATETSNSMSNFLNSCPKESCVTAFFKNMTDLERWASEHPSHLAIHAGAISHARRFGDTRKFRTWHEVSVIRGGEAGFEYVNCIDGTGVECGMISVERTSL
ncbi:hem-containing dehydratase protein [Penicillium citrinum]|uniref:Hem-containing dehydratase protein n=1 Tax=Penicillium citrinum TaxID=5077 RepID=A0A9W9NPN5_PENCI|nr:hem-containing dehydratase protein [Penicillium citrinum]KAJ5222563.1 hem-containing dehydratase protein [Penicillium citrinum]